MREVTIIYGKTGTGKSFYTKKYIAGLNRVIIIDPMQEYTGTVFTTFEDLANYFIEYEPENFCCVCRFESDEEIEAVFNLCKIIKNLHLIIEEAEIYISPYAKSSAFLDLCRYGRHQNISIIGIARRCSELSINFRSLVTKIISFKQTEPKDLKIMQDLGFDNLDSLPEHQYIEIIP